MTVTSWAKWMNDTAGANSAPSWSQGLAANPGCTMASWSVNGTVASLAGDTLVDATGVGCPTVTLQGMTLRISGDVTILADAFSSVNGLTIQSADGLNHTLNIVSPGPRSCSSSHTVYLSASTTSDDHVLLNVDAAGKLTVDGASSITGKASAACLAASGSVTVGRSS